MCSSSTDLKLFTVLLIQLVGLSFAEAQQGTTPGSQKVIQAAAVEEGPVVDGEFGDPQWANAPAISDFRQQEPTEGGQPSERTEVRIIYTADALFLGVWCYDSAPQRIRATERRRDANMGSDDSFGFVLDPSHSHRDSYFFRTNPLGTLWDALITDEGKLHNQEWDGRWEVAAKIHSWGWGAEIRIPFKTLRIPATEESVWGIDFKREIRRKNENVVWSNYGRDFRFVEVSQAGHLMGLPGSVRSLSLQAKPYFVGGMLRVSSQSERLTEKELEVGLENVRYTPTNRLKLDATVNPDFAQAEVDDLRINLTRFSLFFQEKREFFLEDAGLFEFGTGGRGRPDVKLLHTRRIGLTSGRRAEPIPILFGARLTGQFPGWGLGVMNAQTREHEGTPGTNYGAYRVRKNLFARSYVGAMGTHLQNRSEGNNATFGVDANFIFLENLQFQGFVVKSESTGDSGNGWATVPFWLTWDTDRFSAQARHLIVEEDFNAELGFVSRSDIRKSSLGLGFSPRPGAEWLRQLEFSSDLEYLTDIKGTLQSREQSVGFELDLESGDAFGFEYERNLEQEDEGFNLAGRIPVPAGTYRNDEFSLQVRPYGGRRVSGFFQISREDFWGGKKTSLNLGPEMRWSDQFLTEFEYKLEKVVLPQGAFTSHVAKGRLDLNFTNQWLTSTTLQYNHLDKEWGLNFRLNYIYRPGDDIFLVFNRSRTSEDEERSWSVLFKVTHTFDF